MHINSRQVELNLETNVNVGSVDSRRPPKSKSTIRDLVEARSLSVSQLLEFHAFFKTTCLFPK